jgi:TolB-like protein
MSSLISGFEYDIFISYRQKDNKHDGWVTEFVNNLKGELESTFKEEISVYFDINPLDGLLETHDVNASLKEKLKCLIFIPIISQTYCDLKSFAWRQELEAFNKMAKEDRFGRDIKLSSGNITSRILPVKIHDLDQEDKTLLENELGGVLRSIDFIYKSAGVNRPLRANEDHPQNNLNKTYYRDQINKVANAVKEIITSIKKQEQSEGGPLSEVIKAKIIPSRKFNSKIFISSFLMLGLIALGYFFIPKLYDSNKLLDKTIAIIPFRNSSLDASQDYFCDGIVEDLLNNLTKVKEYTVRPRTSTDQYRKTTKDSRTIGNEMNVNYLVTGSIALEGSRLKIWVQLVNAKSEKIVWTNNYEREKTQLFTLQSDITKEIAGELKTALSPEENNLIDKKPTENHDAYIYYLRGNEYYWRSYEKQNFEIAIQNYKFAIEADPGFAMAYVRLSISYLYLDWFFHDKDSGRLAKSKEAIDAAFKINPDLAEAHLALGYYYYLGLLEYSKALKQVSLAEEDLRNNAECIYLRANVLRRMGEWQLAKESFIKATELNPGSPVMLVNVAITMAMMGEYSEAEKYFNKTLLINATFIEATWQKSHMFMKWEGNTIKARKTVADLMRINESISDLRIPERMAIMDIYDGKYEKALNDLLTKNFDIIDTHFYINLKSLLIARVYMLMNLPEKAYEFYNSARSVLESKVLKDPDDPRLYSALGLVYAGLGMKEKAIESGKKGVDLMSIIKDAHRGVVRVEDLAIIYVMVGEYNAALEQIKILLNIPSRLSVKLLLLDPVWKPLWNLPEFKEIIRNAPA